MEYLELLKSHGLPTALLLILVVLLFKTGRWLGDQVLVPLRDTHIDVVNSIKETQVSISTSQANVAATLSRLTDVQEKQAQLHAANTDDLKALRVGIERELKNRLEG